MRDELWLDILTEDILNNIVYGECKAWGCTNNKQKNVGKHYLYPVMLDIEMLHNVDYIIGTGCMLQRLVMLNAEVLHNSDYIILELEMCFKCFHLVPIQLFAKTRLKAHTMKLISEQGSPSTSPSILIRTTGVTPKPVCVVVATVLE